MTPEAVTRVAALALGAAVASAGWGAGPARAGSADPCREPEVGGAAAPMLSPPLAERVVGSGRLQFFSAPSPACRMRGVFVVPGDALAAYARTDDGWSSVTYFGSRTGRSASGWVRSDRLENTGTLGPAP